MLDSRAAVPSSRAHHMAWSSFKCLFKSGSRKSNSLRRISLQDESSDRGTSAPLARNLQPGSLNTSNRSSSSQPGSISSNSSGSSGGNIVDSIAVRNPMRRRSLPAMHLQHNDSVRSSCGMMTNPPVFDNPLRRRGCCNHHYTEQMGAYRHEAIQRELRAKRGAVSQDDITL